MAVMVLAAMATAGLVSCQKEKTDEGQTTQQNPTDKAVVERIKEFKRQVEYHKSHPGLRDATCVSVEEAVWNLEALFNFTYAYPELCYGKTVAADTVLSLPLSANDSVRMTDLVTFYGMVYAAAAAIYQNVDLPDKQFIVLDVEEGECQSSPDDFWLTSSQMNFHFFGERSLVLDTLPSIYPVILPEKELFFINIENYDENSTSAIGHKTTARYGIRVCCSEGDGDKEPLE